MDIFFFGDTQNSLYGVFKEAKDHLKPALLLCPSLGHEHLRSQRALRLLCERWEGASLRFDWSGHGESRGNFPTCIGDLYKNIELSCQELSRRSPGSKILGIGHRISLQILASSKIFSSSAVIGWHAPASSQAWISNLERMSFLKKTLGHVARPEVPKQELFGFSYSSDFLDELRKLPTPKSFTNVESPFSDDWDRLIQQEVPWSPGPTIEYLAKYMKENSHELR